MINDKDPVGDRVLVVDDELSLCGMIGDVLRAEGYEPIICTHPREALTASKQKSFKLAFIDIKLPEINGLELASMIKHHDPLREVVFITGHGTFDNAVQAIKIGAYDYLKKPFSINDLNLCLRRFQERSVLKEKVRMAEHRYFHLVQHIPLIIYVIRRDFHLDFVNQTCFSMLGYAPEEAMNTPNWFLELIHPEDQERVKNLFDSAFNSSGLPFSVECRFIHKKGHLIHAIVKSIPYFEEEASPEVNRLEGIIVDITDRVFLEKALVQKEKLKTLGAISAEVAHEIRNSLVSIGGFARRLQKEFPNLRESDIIFRESQRLEKILDRIRNYLKPVEPCLQECSVNMVIKECVDLLTPEIDGRGIQCRLNLDSGLPLVYADPDALTQVFINMIRNAHEAVDQGGILYIKTYESDQNIHIDFRNPVPIQRIKDPETLFLSLDEGGQSIGLPLSYRLLKNMGGVISYAQEKDHLIFTVSLSSTVEANSWMETTAELSKTSQRPMMRAERRKYPRAEVGWPSTLRTADRTLEVVIRNISMGGAFIRCQRPLELDETFRMVIKAPNRQWLSTTNKVAWIGLSCSVNETTPREMGARFITISNEARGFLSEVIPQ